MKKPGLLLGLLLLAGDIMAGPTAMEVIKKMDALQNADNQIITSSMTIKGRRATRTIESKSWILGDEKSFTEYLAPAREKGTKMLKVGDKLWIYYPRADRVVNISGHMLRRSVMGSDMSYEDMMERRSTEETYNAVIEGEEKVGERLTYRILMNAKVDDVAYQKVRIWIDKTRYIALKQELYATSGKLLKKLDTLAVMKTSRGWYPSHIRFKDVLKEGGGTEFLVKSILFDQKISRKRFKKGQLRR
jgi:outer membrane lipoprotein-sorting protein